MINPSYKDVQKNKKSIQPSEGTVSTFFARVLLDYLQSIHLDPETLFEPALIAELKNSDSRISIPLWQEMFERVIAYTGDADVSLKIAEQTQPKHLSMLGFTFMSSQNLGDVISILVRYKQLVDDVNSIKVVENSDSIEVQWFPRLGPPSPIFMQLSLVCWVVVSRQITSQSNIIVDAHFSFPQPANIETYQRIFGGKIYFDSPITKLVVHKSILNLPITLSDPTTNSVLLTQVEKKLQATNEPDFLQQLREYLIAHIAGNQVLITEVATSFGISPRQLQNRLSAYGYGYRNLLEQIRQEQAEYYLSETDLSLNEIATLFGYSDQSSFQHAFKRWTSSSPGSFRKNVGK